MSRPYSAEATLPAGWLTRGRKPSHRSNVVIDRGKDPAKQALPGAGAIPPVRQVLASTAVGLMFGAIKPLGLLLAALPAGPDHPDVTAGASFQLPYRASCSLGSS